MHLLKVILFLFSIVLLALSFQRLHQHRSKGYISSLLFYTKTNMPFLLCLLTSALWNDLNCYAKITFFLVTQLNLEKYGHSSCDESIWSFEPPWLFYFLSLDFSRGQRTSTNSPIQCFIVTGTGIRTTISHIYAVALLVFTNLHMRHASQLLVPNVLVYVCYLQNS